MCKNGKKLNEIYTFIGNLKTEAVFSRDALSHTKAKILFLGPLHDFLSKTLIVLVEGGIYQNSGYI